MELNMRTTILQVNNAYLIVFNWCVYTKYMTQTNNGDVTIVWCAYLNFKTTEKKLIKLGTGSKHWS